MQSKEDAGKVTSQLMITNKFLQKSYHSVTKPKYTLISFEENGNIVKYETIEDTINLNKIIATQYSYYKNNLLQKIELVSEGYKKIDNYYYSKNNFLDSILMFADAKLSSKEIYINNEYGDPTKYCEIGSNADTTMISTLKYEYDKHGNWIKQFEKVIERNKYNLILGDTVPKYSLIVREIKY